MRMTKRKPRQYGSIKECSITEMEKIEYRQTGMIRIKETPVSKGELGRLAYRSGISYYDMVYCQKFNWLDELELF